MERKNVHAACVLYIRIKKWRQSKDIRRKAPARTLRIDFYEFFHEIREDNRRLFYFFGVSTKSFDELLNWNDICCFCWEQNIKGNASPTVSFGKPDSIKFTSPQSSIHVGGNVLQQYSLSGSDCSLEICLKFAKRDRIAIMDSLLEDLKVIQESERNNLLQAMVASEYVVDILFYFSYVLEQWMSCLNMGPRVKCVIDILSSGKLKIVALCQSYCLSNSRWSQYNKNILRILVNTAGNFRESLNNAAKCIAACDKGFSMNDPPLIYELQVILEKTISDPNSRNVESRPFFIPHIPKASNRWDEMIEEQLQLSIRNNLVLFNVPFFDYDQKNPIEITLKVLEHLELSAGLDAESLRCKWMGPALTCQKNQLRTRKVIMSFNDYAKRSIIWENKRKFKEIGMRITEHLTTNRVNLLQQARTMFERSGISVYTKDCAIVIETKEYKHIVKNQRVLESLRLQILDET